VVAKKKAKPKRKPAAKTLPNLTAKKRAFLAAFAVAWTVGKAAKASGISRHTVWEWTKSDPEFKQAFDDARLDAAESMEQEATRRATEGVRRLKFYKGQLITVLDDSGKVVPYVEHEFSDTLLIFRLKAELPEKYGDKVKVDQKSEVEMTLKGATTPLPSPEEAMAEYAELLEKFQQAGNA
jgi:hypothetical protein